MTEEYFNADDDEVEEVAKSAGEQMREYVEKVSATMGDNGANAKSVVAGKNDMGGKAVKFDAGGDEKGRPAPKAQTMATGNRNVPGGKADKLEAAPKAKTGE